MNRYRQNRSRTDRICLDCCADPSAEVVLPRSCRVTGEEITEICPFLKKVKDEGER